MGRLVGDAVFYFAKYPSCTTNQTPYSSCQFILDIDMLYSISLQAVIL